MSSPLDFTFGSYLGIQMVPIAATAAGNNTVLAAVPDQRWVVLYMVIGSGPAGDTLTIFSGGTAVSGAMVIPNNFGPAPFGNSGQPIARALNVNQALIFNLVAGNDITGWAIIGTTR